MFIDAHYIQTDSNFQTANDIEAFYDHALSEEQEIVQQLHEAADQETVPDVVEVDSDSDETDYEVHFAEPQVCLFKYV